MTTLQNIINDAAPKKESHKAIQAAYWSGIAKAKAQERESIKKRIDNLPNSRWHRFVSKICLAILPKTEERSITGLYDEAKEIGGYEFNL